MDGVRIYNNNMSNFSHTRIIPKSSKIIDWSILFNKTDNFFIIKSKLISENIQNVNYYTEEHYTENNTFVVGEIINNVYTTYVPNNLLDIKYYTEEAVTENEFYNNDDKLRF